MVGLSILHLRPRGTIVRCNGTMWQQEGRGRAERPEDVRLLGELATAGNFKPVIDRCYAFDQMVEAHRYVDQGHKRGNVVVTLS